MHCPECKTENVEGARFCSNCAAALPQVVLCPSCRAENIEGAKFCIACAWRMDQDRPMATGGRTQAQNQKKALADGVKDAVEAPETATVSASANFCHVCHEPLPPGNTFLDLDGNKMCRKCMMSGGKKKDPRERAIEELKLKMEGPTTKIVHKGPPKPTQLKLKSDVEAAERRRGILLPALGAVVLLLAGAAAAAYFTGAHAIILKQLGIEIPGLSAPKPEPAPEAKSPDSGKAPKPADETKKQPEPPPVSPTDSRIYLGIFKGVDGQAGRHPGSLVFESRTGEILHVILPADLASTASTYVEGKTYMIKFKPDEEYSKSRRVTLQMLEEPIKDWE